MKMITLEDAEVGRIITALAMQEVPLVAKIAAQCAQQQRDDHARAQAYQAGNHAETIEDVAARPRFNGASGGLAGSGHSGSERGAAETVWPGTPIPPEKMKG